MNRCLNSPSWRTDDRICLLEKIYYKNVPNMEKVFLTINLPKHVNIDESVLLRFSLITIHQWLLLQFIVIFVIAK